MAFTEKGLICIKKVLQTYKPLEYFTAKDIDAASATLTSLVKDGYLIKQGASSPVKYCYTEDSKQLIDKHLPKTFNEYSVDECFQQYNMNYDELVKYLINKYGEVSGNFFCTPEMKSANTKIKRSKEGLQVHHIKEDRAIMLSNPAFAKDFPWSYQEGYNLVYCNLVEHMLLHMIITRELTNSKINEYQCVPGIGGVVNYMLPQVFVSSMETRELFGNNNFPPAIFAILVDWCEEVLNQWDVKNILPIDATILQGCIEYKDDLDRLIEWIDSFLVFKEENK